MQGLELLVVGEVFEMKTAYASYPNLKFMGFMNENDEPEEAVRDLDASLLRWTAAVMRQWGDVFDRFNRETRSMNGRNGTITSCTRSLDLDFHFFDTKLTGRIGNGFGGSLSGKWCALATALETDCTGTGPAQCVPVRIRNCHQSIIERRFDMHNSSADITPRFALLGLGHF